MDSEQATFLANIRAASLPEEVVHDHFRSMGRQAREVLDASQQAKALLEDSFMASVNLVRATTSETEIVALYMARRRTEIDSAKEDLSRGEEKFLEFYNAT